MEEPEKCLLLQIIGKLTVDNAVLTAKVNQLATNLEHTEEALKMILAAKQEAATATKDEAK